MPCSLSGLKGSIRSSIHALSARNGGSVQLTFRRTPDSSTADCQTILRITPTTSLIGGTFETCRDGLTVSVDRVEQKARFGVVGTVVDPTETSVAHKGPITTATPIRIRVARWPESPASTAEIRARREHVRRCRALVAANCRDYLPPVRRFDSSRCERGFW
jgi:hypothetical protein